MTTIASQITSLTVVYSTVYSDADQRKHQSSASLAIVWGIHRDRWIPRTKGQLRGKCFHLMTSSWLPYICAISTDTWLTIQNSKNIDRCTLHITGWAPLADMDGKNIDTILYFFHQVSMLSSHHWLMHMEFWDNKNKKTHHRSTPLALCRGNILTTFGFPYDG